jgi:hypothetical protein
LDIYFSDVFNVSKKAIDDYGAFDISLFTDLPLFVDPFLLFTSKKQEYKLLHQNIIDYLEFLKDKSLSGELDEGLINNWFHFPEIKQTWFGFSEFGNGGHGNGDKFAHALNKNLYRLFGSFGSEGITKGTHLEKLCLLRTGVGRDMISDFTTNLIKNYIADYTQKFALENIDPKLLLNVPIKKAKFDYDTETWLPVNYTLPIFKSDFVLLTPKDILTKDENWINSTDFFNDFDQIVDAFPDKQLRATFDNYLKKALGKNPKKKEVEKAYSDFSLEHPEIIDYFIKDRENKGDQAIERSINRVLDSDQLFIEQSSALRKLLSETPFYNLPAVTKQECLNRLIFLKDVIENKDGWRMFYGRDGNPVAKEDSLQIMYRLTWYASPLVVTREAGDGRGSSDFKISLGSKDQTIVELKLASNSQLRKNLQNQVPIYQKASDAISGLKGILYFTSSEFSKVQSILKDLKLKDDKDILLIDAQKKTPASKVAS